VTAAKARPARISTGGSGTAELLRHRDFAIYATTSFVSNCGTFMQSIGVPFVMHELTGSNTWVGASVFANWFGSLLVGPMAGPISDQLDRRRVLIWSNIVQLLIAVGLLLLALTDRLHPWPIMGLLTLAGLAAGFQYSSSQALVPVLVPPELAIAAVRMNSVGFTAARAIGPAVAGLTLGTYGIKTTFALNAASFAVFLAGLAVIHPRPAARKVQTMSWMGQFGDGFRYLWARPAMRMAVITAFVVGMFGSSVVQLSAGLAAEVYDIDGRGLGFLTACFGIGSVTASVIIVRYGNRVRRSRLALVGVFVYASGIAAAVAIVGYPAVLPAFVLLGLGHVLSGVSLNTTIQAQVDEEYRGRAITFFLMAMLGGTPIGALLGGSLGDLFGLRPALGLFSIALFGYVAFAIVRFGGLRLMDAERP
jgi:MFS family permease